MQPAWGIMVIMVIMVIMLAANLGSPLNVRLLRELSTQCWQSLEITELEKKYLIFFKLAHTTAVR